MTIDINGMVHVILTVSRFEVAREFCRKLLPEFPSRRRNGWRLRPAGASPPPQLSKAWYARHRSGERTNS